jgi:hypothetical protein
MAPVPQHEQPVRLMPPLRINRSETALYPKPEFAFAAYELTVPGAIPDHLSAAIPSCAFNYLAGCPLSSSWDPRLAFDERRPFNVSHFPFSLLLNSSRIVSSPLGITTRPAATMW